MDCQDVRKVIVKFNEDPANLTTTAERVAAVNHYRKCKFCQRWREQNRHLDKVQPHQITEKHLSVIDELVQKDVQDPETQINHLQQGEL